MKEDYSVNNSWRELDWLGDEESKLRDITLWSILPIERYDPLD